MANNVGFSRLCSTKFVTSLVIVSFCIGLIHLIQAAHSETENQIQLEQLIPTDARLSGYTNFSEGVARFNCTGVRISAGDYEGSPDCNPSLIDRTESVVVQPEEKVYTQDTFFEGLAPFQVGEDLFGGKNNKIGFFDKFGKVAIAPQFGQWTLPYQFSEGLVGVRVGGEVSLPYPEEQPFLGFIDRAGRIVVEPKFKAVEPFSEGLAAVKLGELWGFVNASGKIVIEPQFPDDRGTGYGRYSNSLFSFSEGRAGVFLGDKFGYIDPTGRLVIPGLFDGVKKFSEGLAAVRINGREEGKFGYIDAVGELVIEPQFAYASNFSEGFACVWLNPDQDHAEAGFIDPMGEFIIPPMFNRCKDFSEGLAPILVDGKWGYVDMTGRKVIEPQFGEASSFSEGMARVCPSSAATIQPTATSRCHYLRKRNLVQSPLS